MAGLIFASELRDHDGHQRGWWYAPATKFTSQNGHGIWNLNLDKTHLKWYVHAADLFKGPFPYDEKDCGNRRVDIKEFINRCCTDDVIVDYIDMDYSYQQSSASWNDSGWRTVYHGYWVFYFSSKIEHEAFGFAFSDLIRNEIKDRRDGYEWVNELPIKKGRY